MSQFPTEILINIFQHLHLKQKLECVLVCRLWANVLRAGYLYESIELKNESTREALRGRINALLKKGKPKHSAVKKCKRLVFVNSTSSAISGTTLASTFPNLNYLYFDQFKLQRKDSRIPKNDPFQGWKDNLQVLVDTSCEFQFLLKMLETGPFHCLKTLILDPRLELTYEPEPFYFKLIPKLKSVPTVTTLSLGGCPISFDQLEEIHEHLPQLVSLTLKNNRPFDDSGYQFDKPIVPAEKMRVFNANTTSGPMRCFTDYITKKYPNLNEITHYEECASDQYFTLALRGAPDWSAILPTIGPNLKKCAINLVDRSTTIVDLIAKNAPQLDVLSVDTFTLNSIFNKVVSKSIFRNLHSLSLRQLPRKFNFSEFKNIPNLKTLALNLSKNKEENSILQCIIRLHDIVNYLPKNITSLTLEYADLVARKDLVQGVSNITSLKLRHTNFTSTADSEFLSQHFPALKSLILDAINENTLLLQPIDHIYTLCLPKHHLTYFEFLPPEPLHFMSKYAKGKIAERKKEMLQLKIKTSDQTRHYKTPSIEDGTLYKGRFMKKRDRSIQPVLKPSQVDDELKYFNFECASVETAYFNDYYLL